MSANISTDRSPRDQSGPTTPSQKPQTLLENANENTRRDIVTCFFGEVELRRPQCFDVYFEYYNRELRRLRIGIAPVISGLAAKTHDDLLHICKTLSVGRSRSRSEIRNDLRSHFQTEDDPSIDRSIDLSIRLWLMINVRDHGLSVWMPQQPSVHWEDSSSLNEFIACQFRPSTAELGFRESRLDPSFTVANMVRMCGLQLRWTESLEDHLRLDRRAKVLSVFSYKDFLVGHLNLAILNRERNSGYKAMPSSLLRETITTLNMLFPQWDSLTQTLLREHGQTFDSVPPFEGPRRLNLEEFFHWRVRLLELYEEIYEAPPDSWVQLWVDRRNPHQWYTFWIALVILVLSIVSCAASIVQAWASLESLKLQKSLVG